MIIQERSQHVCGTVVTTAASSALSEILIPDATLLLSPSVAAPTFINDQENPGVPCSPLTFSADNSRTMNQRGQKVTPKRKAYQRRFQPGPTFSVDQVITRQPA